MVTSRTRNRNNRMQSAPMQSLKDQAANIRRDAWGLAESAGAVASEQLDPIRQYVADKPLQSLLIATGAGLLLGFIFGRR